MANLLTATGFATTHHSGISFIDAVLRGIGQVMLQNNAYVGLLFLLGIGLNSLVQALAVLIGAAISTFTAQLLEVDKKEICAGLQGFNGALVGLALLIFLEPSFLTWLTLVIATVFTSLLTLALSRLLRSWQLPIFTIPFVLVSWCIFLSDTLFGRLATTHLLPTASFPSPTQVEGVVTVQVLFESLFTGIGQVFFQGNLLTGIIFLIALLISCRKSAGLAVLGSLIGAVVAWLWGASAEAIQSGIFGFNGVLTGIALAVCWPEFTKRARWLAALALLIVPFIYAALSAALEPLGMPALTLVFILVAWIMLLTKQELIEHSLS